jgi:hypothetical protein
MTNSEFEIRCEVLRLKTNSDRFKDLLRQIAYPRRGSEEENMDIFDAVKLIRSNFTAEELGD